MGQLDRITQHPDTMGGKACIRGMRVTVGMVVGQNAAGHSLEEVLADYPYLDREDILQALRSQPGAPRSEGSYSPPREGPDRHEPVPTRSGNSPRRRFRRNSLVDGRTGQRVTCRLQPATAGNRLPSGSTCGTMTSSFGST